MQKCGSLLVFKPTLSYRCQEPARNLLSMSMIGVLTMKNDLIDHLATIQHDCVAQSQTFMDPGQTFMTEKDVEWNGVEMKMRFNPRLEFFVTVTDREIIQRYLANSGEEHFDIEDADEVSYLVCAGPVLAFIKREITVLNEIRLQVELERHQDKLLAVASASHPRLGEMSKLRMIDPCLLKVIGGFM
jgi:hypothetical protein